MRRDVRVVEGARLESVCRGNSTEGSNPSLSANQPDLHRRVRGFGRCRCHHVATARERTRGLQEPDRAFHRRWRQVHVSLRRRQIGMPR